MSEFRSRWTTWTPPSGAPDAEGGDHRDREGEVRALLPPPLAEPVPGGSVSYVSCQPGVQSESRARGEEEEGVVLHAPRARDPEAGVGDRTDRTDETPSPSGTVRPPARECIPCRLWTELSHCPRCRVHLGGPPDAEPLPKGWDDFAPPLPPCPVPCGGGWGNPHEADCPRGRRMPRGWAGVEVPVPTSAPAVRASVIDDSKDAEEPR